MNKYVSMRMACAAALGLGTFTTVSSAVPVVNGSYDADYGVAGSVQQTPTGFADNNLGQIGFANGSELDAGYGVVSNGRLYLFLAGNLETNFNKLDVFIHTGLGGMSQISNITNNQGNFNNMSGMTFDAGFQAAYWISMTAGGATPDIFVDSANLITLAGNYSGQTTATNGTLAGGNGGAVIEATFNNSNVTGVTASTAPNDAATVNTGMEMSIALADLGNPTGPLFITAFINNGDHNYASNQFLGSLPAGTGNLGGDGLGNFTGNLAGVNLNNFAGNQYFVVNVPEPTTIGLLALASVSILARRRR